MEKKGKCFSGESYYFAMRQMTSRAVKEEKLRIAKSLLEKTDLSISQIADIVGIKKDELEKAFRHFRRDENKVKYQIQSATSREEQLFRDLDKNLSTMKEKQDRFNRN